MVGLLVSLVLSVNVPVVLPEATGPDERLNTALPPEAMFTGSAGPVYEKPAVMLTELIDCVAAPKLLTVSVFGPAAVPTLTAPKLNGLGVAVSALLLMV